MPQCVCLPDCILSGLGPGLGKHGWMYAIPHNHRPVVWGYGIQCPLDLIDEILDGFSNLIRGLPAYTLAGLSKSQAGCEEHLQGQPGKLLCGFPRQESRAKQSHAEAVECRLIRLSHRTCRGASATAGRALELLGACAVC